MNFSSFVAPFSISTALNTQFSSKFAVGTSLLPAATNDVVGAADPNCCSNPEDGDYLKVNAADSAMMAAVSRYQNSVPRATQPPNFLDKYHRDNYAPPLADELPANATAVPSAGFAPSSTVSSLTLLTSKLRACGDNLSGISYGANNTGGARNTPPSPHPHHQLIKHEVQGKRTGHSETIRVQNVCDAIKKEEKESSDDVELCSLVPQSQQQPANISVASWQSIAAVAAAVAAAPTPAVSTTAVADYLSHLPNSSLPISLHNLFKYSSENVVKKDAAAAMDVLDGSQHITHLHNNHDANVSSSSPFLNGQICAKKKKRKKPPKEKKPKPKPGEIRMTTALDGSALFCCPECHMAYPDKGLLEQHLVGHTIERRFFCDICGAGLKRKDHLTRHKQSHNPDRPHACSVCSKAFKRKEQLALHYVIHSGEKRHVCPECGKGFYRKDHLRKHTRSHIARRVKAELSQYVPNGGNTFGSTSS